LNFLSKHIEHFHLATECNWTRCYRFLFTLIRSKYSVSQRTRQNAVPRGVESYLWERRQWWRGGLVNFCCDDGSDCGSPPGLVASDAPPSPRRSTCHRMSLERRNISFYYRATSPIKARQGRARSPFSFDPS